jgi:L,D-peptidoglycan transpeptidase YkuD (ErfK/YbiS/YcfS/YnhG family)
MIELITLSGGFLSWPGARVRAAIGRSGLTVDKHEGDGATPTGIFPLRQLWYRPDRVTLPETGLARIPITSDSGWSDDPVDQLYNQAMPLPHPYRHERLWRDDELYDLIVPLGYNDDPPIAGRGSAIFLHCARPDYAPTEGCVAVAYDDLLALLAGCSPATHIDIRPA